jgi:preprotein translocase subunit YajC
MTSGAIVASLLALQSSPGASFLPFAVQLVAIFGIFYFLLIRPQQQQKKKHEDSLTKLKRGDRVVTAGGIVGEVIHIRETATGEGATARPLDDHVTIKSAESRLVVERGRIVKIMGGTTAPETRE